MRISSFHELVVTLREGPFSSVGSYPKFWVTKDGGILSYNDCVSELFAIGRAMRDGADKQWIVTDVDVNWENPALYSDHSNERIESAYAEDYAS